MEIKLIYRRSNILLNQPVEGIPINNILIQLINLYNKQILIKNNATKKL
jgi:hypothetical protein